MADRRDRRKAVTAGVSYSALGIPASAPLGLGSVRVTLLPAAPDLLNERRSGRPRYRIFNKWTRCYCTLFGNPVLDLDETQSRTE